MKNKVQFVIAFLLLCSIYATAQIQMPYIPDGVIDTTKHETVGLNPAANVKTVTVFKANEQSDHYANGVVLAAFKGKLYCMWQSSPKDEDSDDTRVVYSISNDDGNTWSKPMTLAAPDKDCYCTSGGWLVNGDTLLAFIDTWQKGLSPRGGKTCYITSTDGLSWSSMKPVRMADGSEMDGVLEQDPYRLPDGRIVGATHFMPGLHVCPVYTDDPGPLTLCQDYMYVLFIPMIREASVAGAKESSNTKTWVRHLAR